MGAGMMKEPPDTSWIEMEEIRDGPSAAAWAMFLLTLVMSVGAVALLLRT